MMRTQLLQRIGAGRERFAKPGREIAPRRPHRVRRIRARARGRRHRRIRHRAELNGILDPVFLSRPKQHWIDALAEAGVPCGPVNELHEVFADPQVRERGMVVHLPHPQREAMPMLANPIRLSETPVQYRMRPPALGEHTDEVLADMLGLDEVRRQALRESGVI